MKIPAKKPGRFGSGATVGGGTNTSGTTVAVVVGADVVAIMVVIAGFVVVAGAATGFVAEGLGVRVVCGVTVGVAFGLRGGGAETGVLIGLALWQCLSFQATPHLSQLVRQ